MARKPPFTVTLTDEHRASLERLRQQRGLKSEADVIRQLIERADSSGLPTPERQQAIKDYARALPAPGGKAIETALPVSLGAPKRDYGSRLKKR